MHYQKYTTDELYAAHDAAQTFHGTIFNRMVADPDTGTYWKFLCDLEWEMAAMQNELTRRANPPERIFIQVEVA